MVKQGFAEDQPLKHKLPAWKPFLYRIGKKRLEYIISEQIDFVQNNNNNIDNNENDDDDDKKEKVQNQDMCSGVGIVRCRAELDGVPEITTTLTCAEWQACDTVTYADDPLNDVVPPTHCLSTHLCVSGVFPGIFFTVFVLKIIFIHIFF